MRIGTIQNIGQKCIRWVRISIFTNLYISIAAACFLIANALLLNVSLEVIRWLIPQVFFSTLFTYQLSRWSFHKRAIESPEVDSIYIFLENNQRFTRFSILVSGVLTILFTLLLKKETWLILVILGGISVLYPLKIKLGTQKEFRLRDIPFVKLFLISLVWSGSSVLLPAVESGGFEAFEGKMVLLFILQFLFIWIITLPFDINDLRVDLSTGIKTLPAYIGIKRSKILLSILTFIYSLFLFYWLWVYYSGETVFQIFIGITVLMIAQIYMTWKYSHEVSKWRIMLWYDGTMIWYVMIVSGLMALSFYNF